MQYKFVKFVITVTAVILMSCKPNIKAPAVEKGHVDATRFVAVGNSITSGYADGALYYEGQKNSFVNLIAEQFKLIGGGNFNQPYMNASSVGVGSDGNAPFKLGYATDCLGATSLMPVPTATAGDVAALSTSIYASQGPFNNMGVPGAKVITAVTAGYGNQANGAGNYNPFFYRMAANPTTSSMLSDAVAMNPTFFSLFLGNNDVLAYALAGGNSDFITPLAGPVGVGFEASLQSIVNALTANGANGVIGNIPDITALPYFTTIPYNGLALRQGQADSLNNATGGFFGFKAGNNNFMIEDPDSALGFRHIHAGELILLDVPLDQIKCHGMGSLTPIPDKYVLRAGEIENIQNAITAYNNIIASIANDKGLALVDVNAFLKSAQKGIVYNGVALNMNFVTGGAFSLDGLHLNPIGQALLANEFIKAINKKYSSTIPQVDATKYRGIIFP
ncbi:MAG: hypothetical protein ACXVC6_09465 [Bacteroidia bacterium]